MGYENRMTKNLWLKDFAEKLNANEISTHRDTCFGVVLLYGIQDNDDVDYNEKYKETKVMNRTLTMNKTKTKTMKKTRQIQ